MKNILTVAAVALLASVSGATAATQITFGGFCDGMQLQTADNVNFTSVQTGTCLQGTSVIGAGRVAGNHLKLTVNWRGFTGSKDKKRYVLQFPLRTRGKFKEYASQSGQWILLNTGRYEMQP